MFRELSNQQYQHLTNQKLRLWGNAVFFKILGFACLRIADVLPVVASVPPFFGRTEATIGNTSAVRRLGVCGQAFLSSPSPSPSPVIAFFFCSRPNFSRRTRAETLATQARHMEASRERSDHGLWSFSQADDSKKGNGKWKHGAISM